MNTTQLYEEGKNYEQISTKKIRQQLQKAAPLKIFRFQEEVKNAEHWVSIEDPEFTAICPFSDYPDYGSVKITYVPDKFCLELKSFKLYINAFRNIKIFHETATEIIFADFLDTVKPKKAVITIDMNPRGNVKTLCQKFYRVDAKNIP